MNKQWKNFIKEKKFADFSKGKGKWTDLSVTDLEDPDNVDLTYELYDLIATAYANIGGHLNFQSPEDLPGKEDTWAAVDVDGDDDADALTFLKNKPFLAQFDQENCYVFIHFSPYSLIFYQNDFVKLNTAIISYINIWIMVIEA